MFRILALSCALVLRSSALVLNAPHGAQPRVAIRAGSAAMMAKSKEGKRLTVLLEKDADGLGSAGDLVEVKPAYAENFLLARGYGVVASAEIIKQKAAEKAAAEAAALAARQKAEAAKATIGSKYGKAGMIYEVQVKDGKIDAVTSEEIASELKRAGIAVGPADVAMPELTELGSALAEVRLHPEVTATLKVVVEKSKITFM